MQSIDVNTLKQWMSNGNTRQLLDVREPWEFNHSCIEGSINIPLTEISHRFDELDTGKDIIVICHHGARSLQVVHFLKNAGFNNKIVNLDGGIDAWAELIDPDMPRY
jgi:rhodanese-related sulfurtransferase